MKRKLRVLVPYIKAGNGHRSAALAIEKQYAITGGAAEVRCVDILDHTNRLYRWYHCDAYLHLAGKLPFVFGKLYDMSDRPWKIRLPMMWDLINCGGVLKMIKQYQPDLIICTHGIAAQLVSYWRARGYLSAALAIVLTDWDPHAGWFCRNYDHYFVACEEASQYMQHYGIEADKITVSGIPIDPVFAQEKDRIEMCLKHGLDPERPVALLTGGGFGVGPVEEALDHVMKLKHAAQIVVACGHNQMLKSRVEHMAAQSAGSHLAIKAIGYTDLMDELMAAASLMVGKGGALTLSEALPRKLISIIVKPIPGQELRNTRRLVRAGAALWCKKPADLAGMIDTLLDDPAALDKMRRNCELMARPHAARVIVERLNGLMAAVV